MSAVSYDAAGAAAAVGVSIDVVRRAIRAGDLPARYPKIDGRSITKPLILAADLERWVSSAPTERRAS